MKYYKIAKYNYNSDNYLSEWTSAEMAIEKGLEKECLSIEKEYLQVACNFFYLNSEVIFADFQSYKGNLERIKKIKSLENKNLALDSFVIPNLNTKITNILDYMFLMQSSLRGLNWSLFTNNENYICGGDDYYYLIGIGDNVDIQDVIKGTKLFYYTWHNIFL
jgi:hypothetical protein